MSTFKTAMTVVAAFLALTLCTGSAQADVPKTLFDITLGDNVSGYVDQCRCASVMPMRDAPFLAEADIDADKFPGIRGGSITVGNCKNKGDILRLKFKFDDRSFDFYEELLERYTDHFGKPTAWRGDPFHVVTAWEWLFTEDGETVKLLLMHSKNPEERPGVSIKMTMQNLWNEEYACWKKQNKGKGKERQGQQVDPDACVPQ